MVKTSAAQQEAKKGNDSEMAPQAIEIAQNRLGNGACGVGRRWQRNVAE
jgi:hypothetical protein